MRSASWCCRRPRCWSAATRRSRDFLLPDWRRRAAALVARACRRRQTSSARATCWSPSDAAARSVPRQRARVAAGRVLTGEKFERFDATFVGAGETLSAALAALLATRRRAASPPSARRSPFSTRLLDAGFRPGMGNVLPDRFFWALPEEEEGEAGRCRGRRGQSKPRRRRKARVTFTDARAAMSRTAP